uniref:monoamine oxidase n=1 Tax=Timema monikensis TaxID=170555 RepID=A0A7R9HII4_9NEOP|nr:unnamed protein product [Timema monikensis]
MAAKFIQLLVPVSQGVDQGLSSARLLVSHGVDVIVLEAVDRVGGRTLTMHPPDDDPSVPKFGWADLGASYVGPSQNHILRLCKELGLGTYLCSDKQDFIHYSKGRQFCYQTTWPNLWWSNPLAYLEVVYMCRLMDNMSKEIPLDKPWKAPRAKEWDKLTVQDFLCRHCWTKYGRQFCYQTTWPNLWWSNPLAYLEVVYMCRLMDNMSKEIPLDKPWKAPRAKEWDKLTVQDFLCRHCWTKDGVEFLLAMCNCNNTADGHEMSLLYYLWYMSQGGGLLKLWSVKGGAQERKIASKKGRVNKNSAYPISPTGRASRKGRPHTITTVQHLRAMILVLHFAATHHHLSQEHGRREQQRVHLNQPVVKINYSTKGVCVQTLDGTEFTGTHLILALPPSLQMKIHFDPPLSSRRYGLLQRSPMGLVLKCIIFFNHPFWAEKDTPVPHGLVLLTPHICTPDFPPTPAHKVMLGMGLCQLENGRDTEKDLSYNGLVTCNDDIEVVGLAAEDFKPGVQLAGMICFMYGDQALRMANLTEEERKKKVCQALYNFYKTHAALKPVHYMDKIWSQDTYVGGGYTCYYPPGVLSKYGPAIRESIGGCIFLAGTETALQWTGYMSGAVEAGERAAREVLYSCGKISSSDVYVEEPEFVEVPIQPLEQSLLERFIPSIGFLLAVLAAIIAFALFFSSYQGQWRQYF